MDQWGREEQTKPGAFRAFENFLSPGYLSQDQSTAVDKELQRLYDETGEKGVLPSYADRTIKTGGETYRLGPEEYTQYAKDKGQVSFDLVESMQQSKYYDEMDDAEKVEAITKLYQYADALAKEKAVDGYKPSGWVAKAIEAEKAGIGPEDYVYYMSIRDQDGNGSVTQEEAKQAIDQLSLSRRERAALYELQNSQWRRNPYR